MRKQVRREHFIVEVGRRAWRAMRRRIRGQISYSAWFESQMFCDENCRQRVRLAIADFDHQPEISMLLPVSHQDGRFLREAIDSVRRQIYSRWQLCIGAPAEYRPDLEALFEEYRRIDRRITVVYGQAGEGLSWLANAALTQARGDFVALLADTDGLSEFALYFVAAAINRNPQLDLLYSDEDVIREDGTHANPFFKPQWDPELILGRDYFNGLGVYRRSLLTQVDGFRTTFDDGYCWDLVLRCVDKTHASRIHRIPYVLYHRRSRTSGPGGALKAIEEHIARKGQCARVTRHPTLPSAYQTRFLLGDREPLISLVIPTRDRRDLLEPCVTSILERTAYRRFEIIVVDNQSSEPQTLDYLEHLEHSGAARVLRYPHPFNWSAINNFAVRAAKGELIGLVNNDIEVLSPTWLQDMAALAMRPETGAVGALLLFPDRRVQHSGIILGITGIAGHVHKLQSSESLGYFGRLTLLQDYSAVTGACLVVRTDRYREIGGLDERDFPIAFNDVDLCLKLRERGYRNMWSPSAVLIHHESATRGYETGSEKKARFTKEQRRMREKWSKWLEDDPCYNPNLTRDEEDFSLAWPPRLPRPCNGY